MQFFHRNSLLTILLSAMIFVPMPAFAALDTLTVNIDETNTELQAYTTGTALFMNATDIATVFDAESVDVQKEEVTYIIEKTLFGEKKAVFTAGSTEALLNGKKVTLAAAPVDSEHGMLIPVNVISDVWKASYGANDETLYIHTDGSDIVVPEIQKVFVEQQAVTLAEKSTPVRYIRIPDAAQLKVDVVLAQNIVGKSESLQDMAVRNSAKAAINGGFFQSFDDTKAQEPYGILVKDGKLVHSDNTGSALGFTKDGAVKLDAVRSVTTAKIADTEYAVSLVNHSPAADSNAITLFTPAYGEAVETTGISVVVQNGAIAAIQDTKHTNIPKDGYVLLFTGNKAALTANMKKSEAVSYSVSYVDANNAKIDWSDVQTAIGAGPILLKDGKVVLNPAKEGFTDETSFQISVARSALGITEDGTMLLVGGVKCTTAQMADIMAQLGAVNAISMDSGASSGLYCTAEEPVAAPMKAISNALIIK